MLTARRFRLLAGITALSGYLQIVLGGLVRVSGSGLGCPDWPTCYGKPYPPPNFHAIVEEHRAVLKPPAERKGPPRLPAPSPIRLFAFAHPRLEECLDELGAQAAMLA